MEGRVKRPEREPDVIFPKEKGFNEVEVWIAEKVFCVDGEHFDCVSSSTLGLTNSDNAIQYITLVAESPSLEGTRRQRAAREFFFNLELNLLLD